MKRIVLKLTRSVKRRIERMMHKTTDARLRDRGRIVLLYHRGLGCNEIAETVGCAPATAVRVANRFLNYGEAALEDQRKENGCPKVDPDLLEGLIQILSNSPQDFGYIRPTWTQELLALVLAEQTGVVVSGRTVARMLGTLNARWGRPRPIVESPVSKARKTRRIRRIERLIENLPRTEVAVYVDEVDIHLNPKIGRDWMLPGTQKIVVFSRSQQETVRGWRPEREDRRDRLRHCSEEEQRALHQAAPKIARSLSEGETDPPHPRQLHHPLEQED